MTIGIIGFGKFAKFIIEVIKKQNSQINFKVFSRSNLVDNQTFFELKDISTCDIIIPCVPIKAFEQTVKDISKKLKEDCVVIDVCSIKVHPKMVMLANLPKKIQIIATHPMFGPESYKKNDQSVKGFNMVIENVRCKKEVFDSVIDFLSLFELNIIEMSCEDHDKIAAVSHFTTMFTGFMLKGTGIKRSKIDTYSASKLNDVVEIVNSDLEILQDMYRFNPFCQVQLDKLNLSFNNLKSATIN